MLYPLSYEGVGSGFAEQRLFVGASGDLTSTDPARSATSSPAFHPGARPWLGG